MSDRRPPDATLIGTASQAGLDALGRLDIPLIYKPGESPEKIAEFSRGFVGKLAGIIHEKGLARMSSALPQ